MSVTNITEALRAIRTNTQPKIIGEGFSVGNLDRAVSLMQKYLQKKLGTKVYRMPGVEEFISPNNKRKFGIRFFFGNKKSFRINFIQQKSAISGTLGSEVESIDFWLGKQKTTNAPDYKAVISGVPMIQALPSLADFFLHPENGFIIIVPSDPTNLSESLNESLLMEAKLKDFNIENYAKFLSDTLSSGEGLNDSLCKKFFDHNVVVELFKHVVSSFSLQKKGAKYFAPDGKKGSDINIGSVKACLLKNSGGMQVTTPVQQNDTVLATKAEEEVKERIPFESQIAHLESLVTGICKGAFNALFVAGKGGTGKTETIERVLSKNGLEDNNTYFKITGSASAIGIYRNLYKYKDKIILFDDCDSALGDQDARNIIKAATDTKKDRKLSWGKKASWAFDPKDDEAVAEAENDPDMAPMYYYFTGRVIFVSNLNLNKLDPDGAIRTRAFIVNIDPTDNELYDYMEKILFDIRLEDGLSLSDEEKKRVFAVVKNSKRSGDVSIRKLVRALNLAATGIPNWKELVDLYC